MSDGKTILVITDPANAEQPALDRGAWLAAALGAELAVVAFGYDQQLAAGRFLDPRSAAASQRELLAANIQQLETLVTGYRRGGLTVDVDARLEHPLDRGVLSLVAERQPLLVVKETRYHGLLQRAFFSNADWMLVRRCAAPLLLVKSRAPAATPKVLAAVDPLHELDKPAELDHAILALSKELVTATHGKLEVFHAYDPAAAIAGAAGSLSSPIAIPVRELTAHVERLHRMALTDLLSEYPVDSRAVHVHEGVPAERLIALTRLLPADIVVMGAVARGGARRILVGSTAERVLDHLPCDLLVVKPPGFVADAS